MFRYLALIWNPREAGQTDVADLITRRLSSGSARWRRVFDRDGLRAFCIDADAAGLDAHLLGERHGAVLGALFEQNSSPHDDTASRRAVLGETETRRIVQSRGHRLITDYWGNYVAFLREPGSEKTLVIKDPTGSLPCLATSCSGVAIFFSCMADCSKLGLLRFTVDWSYILRKVAGPVGPSQDCGLSEVRPVHRGECVEIDPTVGPEPRSRNLYWHPLEFLRARDARAEDREWAASALRSTIVSGVHTWAKCHERSLLRLSGGLDSSIVLGCLQDAPVKPRITAYTYYMPTGRADPRKWARIAASSAGCEHLECVFDPGSIPLEVLLRQEPASQPAWAIRDAQTGPIERKYAAERDATAVFTGDGGDCGLGAITGRFGVEQYLERHGVRPRVLAVALQVAMLTNVSVWRAMAPALKSHFRGIRSEQDVREVLMPSLRLVSAAAREQAATSNPYEAHPWFASSERAPWDIARQLGDVAAAPVFYDSLVDADVLSPQRVEPMYSQPMVELFLRIPSYVLSEGGVDRGLARRAFSGRVPSEILARRWKDRAPQAFSRVIEANLTFVRELLLDGILVEERILDRAALEHALAGGPTRTQFPEGELLSHIDVEAWLRCWRERARFQAAA